MVSDGHFKIYREAVEVLERNGVEYVIGGGIAVMAYGRKRDTKDIDLYIEVDQESRALEVLASEGFVVDAMPDVNWLSKAYKGGITVDFIIENVGGLHTTRETLDRGRYARINGYRFKVMAPEDLIIRKILAMRSDRNDWFDCISVLSRTYETFDWEYFIRISSVSYDRALSFLLYVSSDQEHVIPVPRSAISALAERVAACGRPGAASA
jgi:predicted nucleotidyltransferase